MPVIVSEFHLFQVEGKLFFGDAMELGKSFFSIAPEAFKAIYIDLAGRKTLCMVYSQVPVTTEHKGIVASEFIRVDYRAALYGLDSHVQDSFGRDIFNYLDFHHAVSLEDAKDGYFASSAPATFALASSTKVGLIEFYLSVQHFLWLTTLSKDSHSQNVSGLEHCRITESCLLSNFSGRDFNLEELNDPKPFFVRDSQLVNPPSREVVEGIFTPLTAISFTSDSIDFIALTSCAKNVAIFRTKFFKEHPGPILCFTNEFKGLKGFQFHRHHYNLVSYLLQLPKKIILFGSRARGDYTEDSDYDFILVFDAVTKELKERLHEIKADMLLKYDMVITAIPYTNEDVEKRRRQPFLLNVEKEGAVL